MAVPGSAFLIIAQIIIFLLAWPLEWSEIIIIFVPIFLPLLAHFNIDPLLCIFPEIALWLPEVVYGR